jgi:hypothetical protein
MIDHERALVDALAVYFKREMETYDAYSKLSDLRLATAHAMEQSLEAKEALELVGTTPERVGNLILEACSKAGLTAGHPLIQVVQQAILEDLSMRQAEDAIWN